MCVPTVKLISIFFFQWFLLTRLLTPTHAHTFMILESAYWTANDQTFILEVFLMPDIARRLLLSDVILQTGPKIAVWKMTSQAWASLRHKDFMNVHDFLPLPESYAFVIWQGKSTRRRCLPQCSMTQGLSDKFELLMYMYFTWVGKKEILTIAN